MKDKVLFEIKEHKLIDKGENVVVGLSGGPDSMALLHLLLEVKAIIDFNIYVAHVNHGVRGEEALRDQLFSEQQASKLGLPYYTKNIDMIKYGKDNKITAEEAGRKLRYGFFREILNDIGGGKIAVAHNKNDQAETLIMRFLRGTGVDGLRGMEYISNDIIRPILGIDREDIERYIIDNNIETVLDHTNLKPIYTRNKIRLELIPYIEKNFNSNIIETLFRMSKICALDSEFLNKYTQEKYNEILKKEEKNDIVLNGQMFLDIDTSIQKRIIRNALLQINGSLNGITEVQVSSFLDIVLKRETGKEFHFSNNIIGNINYNDILIKKHIDKVDENYIYELQISCVLNLPELGYSIYTEIISIEKYSSERQSNNARYFDLDKIRGKLYVRNRKAGDRFVPFGMDGTKKIKDYFIDEKISKDLRDKILLIVDEESIIWVLGYRTDDRYKITDRTKKVLKISYEQDK